MPSNGLEYRVNGLKICKKCSEFELECVAHIYVLRESFEESLTLRPTATTLHNTFAELQASAKLGCNSCLVWHKAILNECRSSTDEDLLYQSHTPVILVPPITATNTGFWVAISSPIKTKVRLAPTRSAAWAIFDAGINRDPFDRELWQGVKRQLSNCRNTHESCKLHPGSGRLPRRLICLQNDETARLCETADLPQKPDYLALSYLWGGDQRVKFTAEHERRLKNGVPRTEFPMTIQDTFKVCRLLNISYVWIDALCIRQDDGGVDFREESERMDQIYGSATITLIAAKAQGVQEGFLMPRPMEQYSVDPWKTDYADQMLMIPRKGLTEVRAMSPLAKRGWCFQEELLSTRLLYMTGHGVFWSCSESKWAEHGSAEGEVPYSSAVLLDPHFFVKSDDRLSAWDRLVNQYSLRDVTFARDRLQAVRGLANSIEQRSGDELLFGMWRGRLPVQPLWTSLELKSPTAHPEGASIFKNAPSWSWVSTPPAQAILMPDSQISHAKANLLGVQEDERRTCLKLHGSVRPLLTDHQRLDMRPVKGTPSEGPARAIDPIENPEASLWAMTEAEIFIREDSRGPVVIQLDRTPSVPVQELVCFEINYKGFLLLEPISKRDQLYKRVGCSQLHDDPEFFALGEAMTVRVF